MRAKLVKKFLVALLKESLNGVPIPENPNEISIRAPLLIKDDENGIEYTVSSVDIGDLNEPVIKCYRHNADGTRTYIDIDKKAFRNYSRV